MSGNKRSARFPVSAAFQTGSVHEPDADYDARSSTWVARGEAREQKRTNVNVAMVAGVLAVSAAIAFVFVKYFQPTEESTAPAQPAITTRDHDSGKGAIEDERPSEGTNAPGLDNNGMPNDETAITEDALGARQDGTQG
jgi:hypothetical protein